MKSLIWVWFLLPAPVQLLAQEHRSPYAGEQQREVKALSADELGAYLAGEGMGLAKAAELNGYPGPLHVLELAQQLGLTEAEKGDTERVRSAMLKDATRLGKLIVDKESELDKSFGDKKIDEDQLRSLVVEISHLQGELRIAHLRAHLEMRRVLKPEQVKRYTELRGYESPGAQHKGHSQ